MKIREIEGSDLSAVILLLCEGFPKKNKEYWQKAIAVLAGRPRCRDVPIYGIALEIDNTLQGLILVIASQMDGNIICNISSWYVRPEYRKYSPFLFQRILRLKDVSFTDCSPAQHVLPIVTKFGFQPYTGGTLLVDARACCRRGGSVNDLNMSSLKRIDPALQEMIESHLSYGCQGFLVTGKTRYPAPVLYRTTRLKRIIPAAQFIYGDPSTIAQNAGALARKLLRRGVLVMLIDQPSNPEPILGRSFPEYNLRYIRGPHTPPVGNLLDTEIALFGL